MNIWSFRQWLAWRLMWILMNFRKGTEHLLRSLHKQSQEPSTRSVLLLTNRSRVEIGRIARNRGTSMALSIGGIWILHPKIDYPKQLSGEISKPIYNNATFIVARNNIEILDSMIEMAYGLPYGHEDSTITIDLVDAQLELDLLLHLLPKSRKGSRWWGYWMTLRNGSSTARERR